MSYMKFNIMNKGTIYLRDNTWFKRENVIKMGIASFAKDRSNTYITGEVERGEYILVIEIPLEKMRIIDNCLKNYFKPFNVYRGGGTEFYDRNIINLIELYLQKLNIEYRVLTKDEIDFMNRCERLRNLPNIKNIKNLFNNIYSHSIKPNNHQQYVLDIIDDFYKKYNIGKLIWACGLGKALLSILIIKLLKFRTISFGVPSNNLQKQIKNEILKIFPNKNNILFVGSDGEDGIKSTTDKKQIILFLKKSNIDSEPKFVISTYHSCHLLVDNEINFDLKIGDEAHHLAGIERENEKCFHLFHKINCKKTLYMTATERMVETRLDKIIYSMDDENLFGKYIDIKSVQWAIENKKITDYNILVLKNTENEVNEIIHRLKVNVSNKELFISCYMCLKSFEKYGDLTHILLYTNTTDEANTTKKYIDEILSLNILSITKENLYNNALHSKNYKDLKNEISKFREAPYGIISCVYIFGEGFDLPKLNGVCIVGNMQSEIRIVQYLLRPNRLEKGNPNKKAYVIIPYIDSDDWTVENKSYEKIRNIISQMRNVDKNIEQKIFISICKKQKRKKGIINEDYNDIYEEYDFEENGEELNKIKLRLRYSKALRSNFTEEQDEYNYVRSINISLNIQSRKEYLESREKHSNFIDFPEEYFKLKGVWNSWYDFMGVNITKFIQSKEEWINFCLDKNIKSLDDYFMLCDIYDVLPKEPADFYREFTTIPMELGLKKIRRK